MTNYYEILGVSRGAEAPEISQIYSRLLQEQYQEMGKEADLASLSQAHKTLTNPAKRREYDALLDLLSGQFTVENPEKPTKAEKAYLDGLKAFDLQNYQEAVQ
ncbi:MAG: DnaJ domain-containing protein, partial [bacterium]|nr:DnaJ domain-containing protein [bacterium]